EVDALDRVISATNDLTQVTAYQYNNVHKILQVTDANTNAVCTEYDCVYRRTSAIDGLSHAVDFTYDGVGNLLTQTAHDATTNQITTYEYDNANRRITESYPDDEDSHTHSRSFQYN